MDTIFKCLINYNKSRNLMASLKYTYVPNEVMF